MCFFSQVYLSGPAIGLSKTLCFVPAIQSLEEALLPRFARISILGPSRGFKRCGSRQPCPSRSIPRITCEQGTLAYIFSMPAQGSQNARAEVRTQPDRTWPTRLTTAGRFARERHPWLLFGWNMKGPAHRPLPRRCSMRVCFACARGPGIPGLAGVASTDSLLRASVWSGCTEHYSVGKAKPRTPLPWSLKYKYKYNRWNLMI